MSSKAGVGETLYGVYALCTAIAVAAVCAGLVALVPGRSTRLWITRGGARLIARLVGVQVHVVGTLPSPPFVLVANHESFIDSGVIFAACEGPLSFLVGSAFENKVVIGKFLSRIGAQFVASSPRQTRARLLELARSCQNGGVVVAFPEGSLSDQPGLRPLHPGAFLVASEAGVAVVPVALIGAREVLGPHRFLPKRAPVRVVIGEPILPEAGGTKGARMLAAAASKSLSELLSGA